MIVKTGDQEDPTFAACLRSVGINPTNTLDNNFRERFLPFRPGDHMEQMQKEHSWFWRHKHPNVGILANCCSIHPISFHNFKKNPDIQFNELDLKYNVPEGINGKVFEIPKEPDIFLFDKEGLPFEIDEFRNTKFPPPGQRIYLGPNQTRFCWQCDHFDYK